MGFKEGETCPETGVYKCANDGKTVALAEGESFPECEYCRKDGGKTNWIMKHRA